MHAFWQIDLRQKSKAGVLFDLSLAKCFKMGFILVLSCSIPAYFILSVIFIPSREVKYFNMQGSACHLINNPTYTDV